MIFPPLVYLDGFDLRMICPLQSIDVKFDHREHDALRFLLVIQQTSGAYGAAT
jgi:hypothetical protein